MNAQPYVALLVTSGDGPDECTLAVAKILSRMATEAETAGLTLDISKTMARHGPKSAVVLVHGKDASVFRKRWVGTILWHCKSPLRREYKRSNWFVAVHALASDRSAKVQICPQDVTYESFRAGGPGGQHQNKTDSAIRATHRPTGLSSVSRDMRSQHRNKAQALARLQGLLDAQAMADQTARRTRENRLRHKLDRGNPVRCFKGSGFHEDGG